LRRFLAEPLHFAALDGRLCTNRKRGAPARLPRIIARNAEFSLLRIGFRPMSAFESTLAFRVDQALQTNPYVSGRTLRFETDGSRIVLQGSVKSYFQKQMAQEVIRKVEGVEQIDNCLEVLWA